MSVYKGCDDKINKIISGVIEMKMNSIIFNNEHKAKFAPILKQMNITSVNSKWNLLYKGSEHEFDSDAFYKLCGNQENLLIIIKSEQGNIFGGYSVKGWKALNRNQDIIQYTRDEKAFLFCFDHDSMDFDAFPIQSTSTQYATVSIPNYQCAFGKDGQDLCLSMDCHVNNESFIAFDDNGTSYNIPSKSYSHLNKGFNWFKVKEIEIFQKL